MSVSNNEMTSYGVNDGSSTNSPPKHELNPELSHRMIDCGGDAQLFISENGCIIMNKSNGVTVNEYGTYFDGKINIGRPPSDVRVGGFWVFNDKLLTGLPSTLYTPIPTLVYKEPQDLKYMQKIISIMSSLG